jgi:hypothetical protein
MFWSRLLLAAGLSLLPISSVSGESGSEQHRSRASQAAMGFEDDPLFNDMLGMIINHNIGMLGGIATPFPASSVFETYALIFDLWLKSLPPYMEVAPDLAPIHPNTADQCHFRFVMPQARVEFSNFFGLANLRPVLPSNKDNGTGWFAQQNPATVDPDDVDRIESCVTSQRLRRTYHQLAG